MTRLFTAQPITIHKDAHARPTGFTLHGSEHRFARIVQHWEVDTDWWQAEGRIWRAYWTAITRAGVLCVVYEDKAGGGWWLAKLYD